MIALKLVFQSLAGVGAVVGVAGSGYYVINKVETTPSENIIVLFSTTTSDISTNSEGYICKVNSSTETTQSTKDNDCQIYSFSLTPPKATIDFASIISKPENKVTGNLLPSKKYILTISKTAFDSVSATDKTIEIFNKKTPKTSLIKFSPKLTLEGRPSDPKPNLIFAQAFKLPATPITETLASGKKYFCEFLDSTIIEKFECDVYKNTKAGNELTDTELKNSTKTTAPSDITKGNYFVINLKTPKLAKSELRNKKIKLSIGTSSTTTLQEVATFLYEQSLVGDLTATDKFIYRISPSKEIYYVVQMGEKGEANTTELQTSVAGDAVQNYECKLDESVDTSCKLFTLPAFSETKNSVTHEEVLAATTTPKIAELINGNYFKISLNPSNIQTLNWDGSAVKTIKILSTDETPKTYATLKIIAKEEKEKIIGKTSLVVGKIKNSTAADVTNITCSLSTGASQECTAFSFAAEPSNGQTTKDLKFETTTEKTTLATGDAGKYLLLDLKTQSFEFEELKTKEVLISLTSGSDTSSTTTFTLESLSPVFGTASKTQKGNKVIFLK